MSVSRSVAHINRKVLVIDDEPVIIGLIKLILHEKRHDEVIGAVEGLEGLAKAQKHRPDFILLDISMPGPDGYEVCRRLRAMQGLQNVPIMFIAAKPAEEVYPLARSLGAAGYLQKPFDPQLLLAARKAVLNGKTYYPLLSQGC